MGRRLSPEAKKNLAMRAFDHAKSKGFAGFYRCNGTCNEVTYCAGKYRENVKCRPCSGATKENA